MHTQESTENEYRGSIKPDVEQWFTEWGSMQYNNVKQILTHCNADLEKGKINDALTRLKSFARTLNKEEAPAWIDDLDDIVAQIPDHYVLPQVDRHFKSSEDESGTVRFVKMLKRNMNTDTLIMLNLVYLKCLMTGYTIIVM